MSSSYLLLIVGSAILAGVVIGVVLPNLLPTPRGALNRQRRELRHRLYELARAERSAQAAARRFSKLQRNASNVEPMKLDEAEAQAKDMQTMLGHARDKVMVAQNHLRRIILDHYPPARQEKMLRKYVPQQAGKALPFSF